MGDNTKIEWTDASWNPIIGCSKVSPGCDNCYAERMARRQVAMGRRDYGKVVGKSGKWNGKCVLRPGVLGLPLHWKKPRRIFVCSMSDLFHPAVPADMVGRVLDIVYKCPQHTFQFLTKRPIAMKPTMEYYYKNLYKGGPFKNLWLGVTVENQGMVNERVPILLETPAAVRFVSVEPMLGPVDLYRGGWTFLENIVSPQGKKYGKLDWVICGGETGPGARPMLVDWALNLKDQCAASNARFFFKGHGTDGSGPCMKKQPGYHLLAGREWNQIPERTNP